MPLRLDSSGEDGLESRTFQFESLQEYNATTLYAK